MSDVLAQSPARSTDAPSDAVRRTLAVDVGTASIRIADERRLLVNEPAVVAIGPDDEPFAAGHEAFSLLDRAPHGIDVFEPIARSAVGHADLARTLLVELADRIELPGVSSADVVVVTSPRTDAAARSDLETCVREAWNVEHVVLLEGILACAAGSGALARGAVGSMVVDIGRGSTEAALLAHRRAVTTDQTAIGTFNAERDVVDHLADHLGVRIHRHAAERLVRGLTSRATGAIIVHGQDADGSGDGVPVRREELLWVVDRTARQVATFVEQVLASAPRQLVEDVLSTTGITLTGGGARLAGTRDRIAELTGADVQIAVTPELAAINGARRCLRELTNLRATGRRGRTLAVTAFPDARLSFPNPRGTF